MKKLIIIIISILAFFAGCAKNNATSEMTFLTKKLPDLIREKEADYKCKYKNQTSIETGDIQRLLSKVPSLFAKFTDDLEAGNYQLSQMKEICYAYPEIYVKFINSEEKLSIAEWRQEYGFEFFKNENGDILTFDDKKNILLPKTINKDSAQRGDILIYSADSISTPEKWQFFLVEKSTLTAVEIENCDKSKKCIREYEENDKDLVNQNPQDKACQVIKNEKKREMCLLGTVLEDYNISEVKTATPELSSGLCGTAEDPEGRDLCLLDFGKNDFYNSKELKYKPEEICGKISKDSTERAQCFWGYAMRTKNQGLCEFLPGSIKEIEKSLNRYKYKEEYTTKNECKSALQYSFESAEWKLTYGIPPYADPFNLVYEGAGEIEGWMIFTTSYVSDLSAHFHVSLSSIKKLPPLFQNKKDFLVQYKSKDGKWIRLEDQKEMSELFEYNENNPGKIRITSVFTQMEGSPTITLEKIIE